MPYRVGFDVGGTFTDFVLQSPTGELTTAKRLTTYPDPSEACLASSASRPARHASDGSGYVVSRLAVVSSPVGDCRTKSVNVPPTSKATRYGTVSSGDPIS